MPAAMLETTRPPIQLLCMHGAGAGGWEWAIWARVFTARGVQVRAPDLLAARSGLAATNFADYRQQVRDWIGPDADDTPGAQRVLAGASLGGLLALSVAAEVRPAALILVNPMPPALILPRLSGEPYPEIVRWGEQRSIAGTRRVMPDADDAACLFAFRRWRDESGAALERARRGVTVEFPQCPILVLASERDTDVPAHVSRELAVRCGADFELLAGCSHVGPLLGVRAGHIAERAVSWVLSRLA